MIPEFSKKHFEKSGIIHTKTRSHNSEKPNPQQPRCTNFRSISKCNIFLTFPVFNLTRIVQFNFQLTSSPRYEIYLRRVKRSQYMEAVTFTLIFYEKFRRTCGELYIIRSAIHISAGLNFKR